MSLGDQTINASIGLGGHFNAPLSLSYENAIHEFAADHLLTVGGHLGFATGYTGLCAESNYHYTGVDKFDFYGGLRAGWNLASDNNYFLYSAHIGSNYYVTPRLAIKMELGYGLSSLMVGVSYKL